MLDILPSEPIADIDGFVKVRRQLEEDSKKQEDIKADLEDEADDTDEGVIQKQKELDTLLADIATLKNKVDVFVSGIENFDSVTLSENISKLMKRYGLTMQDLEVLLGVSNGYVARTMGKDSKKRLSIDIVWKIAKLFQINVSDLVNADIDPPVEALQPVIDFVDSLSRQTDSGEFHWENHGRKRDDITIPLFRSTNDGVYCPEGCVDEKFELIEDVYSVHTNIGTLFYTKKQNEINEGYDIYVLQNAGKDEAKNHRREKLSKICSTIDDRTGRLKVKCDRLLEVIKLHASDFVVSDEAKNLIDKFLGRGIYDYESLPSA